MSLLAFRKARIDQVSAGRYAPSQATVTSYRAGATVNGDQNNVTTINVRRAHRFPAAGGVKSIVMRYSGGTWQMVPGSFRSVSSATDSTVVVGVALSVLDNDYLVNLGADTGTSAPNFDQSPVRLFTDPDGKGTPLAGANVTPNPAGDYWFFTREDRLWEVVRESTTPLALILDALDTPDAPTGIRFAHKFATGGTGIITDPWVTSGSNPIQAALDDLPLAGGQVLMIPGYFDVGSGTNGVNIPVLLNGTDKRSYRFLGAGRDLVYVRYSGTGSAFRYAQVNAGSPGSSFSSNQLYFDGFTVQQTGAVRTGNAFYMTYLNESIFRNLGVGTARSEGDTSQGEPDNGFAYGIRLDGTPGDNVVDFNSIESCYFSCNSHAVYIQNQGDRTRITGCHFGPNQLSGNSQDGVEVHNSGGVSIWGNSFNYFGKNSNNSVFGGLAITGQCNGISIFGNYFEGNYPYSIYVSGDADKHVIDIRGNSISFTGITNANGIRVGQASVVFKVEGVQIAGNGFQVLSATNTGVRIDSEVRGFVLSGNGYWNTGGVPRQIVNGACGVVIESFDETNYQPMIWLYDRNESNGRLRLTNQNVAAQASPSIEFQPGGGAPAASVSVNASGMLQAIDGTGSVKWGVGQNGDLTHFPLGAASPVYVEGSRTETFAVTATPFTDSTIDLPANSIILSVVGRVIATIPTAATFDVGVVGSTQRFATLVPVAAGTTFVGLRHLRGNVASEPDGPTQAATAKVRITPNVQPATGAGTVKIVINYRTYTGPTS